MSSNFSPIYGESPTGTRLPVNVDASGNLNVNTTPAAGGTQAVNLTQVNGVAVSASNPVPVAPNVTPAGSAALSSVAGSVSSVILLAGNGVRRGASFFNDSSATLYLAYAATASTTAYTTQVPANSLYELPFNPVYTGNISGIWSSATGAVRITEITA